MASIKKLSKKEYEEKLLEQDRYLGEGDEYLDDGYEEEYEEDYEEPYDEAYDEGEYAEDDGYYDENEEYSEDEEYYDGDDAYYEDDEAESYDDEAYDGEYEDDGYYDEADEGYEDDGDLEYLDEEEFYDENGRSLGRPEDYLNDPHYEEIHLHRRRSTPVPVSDSRSLNSRSSGRGTSENRSTSYRRQTPAKSSSGRSAKAEPVSAPPKRRKKRSIGARIWGVVWRVLVFILVTLVMAVVFCYGAVKLILLGPSSAMSTQYVSTFHETSALKWLPGLFMTDEEVEAILAKNMMPEVEEGTVSDKDLIVIDDTPKEDVPPIQLEEIFGSTYHGYMMIVQDPSTVYLGVLDQFAQTSGWVVPQFCEKYGAIGGVNGGEFVDMGSYSYTAMPVGGVISHGQGLFENNASGGWKLVCMTNENKILLLKGYSVKAALEMGVRDGCHVRHETGPFLIIDGQSLELPDTEVYGGGKNPRTAIGQRSDGVILLCVIDGRQASSLGATFKDMIDIMKEYGAVNAACLDGGTSTQMCYEGEIVNNPYSPTGPRRCPTAWLVGGGN